MREVIPESSEISNEAIDVAEIGSHPDLSDGEQFFQHEQIIGGSWFTNRNPPDFRADIKQAVNHLLYLPFKVRPASYYSADYLIYA